MLSDEVRAGAAEVGVSYSSAIPGYEFHLGRGGSVARWPFELSGISSELIGLSELGRWPESCGAETETASSLRRLAPELVAGKETDINGLLVSGLSWFGWAGGIFCFFGFGLGSEGLGLGVLGLSSLAPFE